MSNGYLHPTAATSSFGALHGGSDEDGFHSQLGFGTTLMHADTPDVAAHPNFAVAPDLTLSTTYRTPHPTSAFSRVGEEGAEWQRTPTHIYSRYTSGARGRAEEVLSGVMEGHAITYASGLNAAYAAVVHYQPRTIALRRGYFGVHESFEVYKKSKGDVQVIDLDAEYPTEEARLPLLVWVETPLNPSGEARDIAHYVKRAKAHPKAYVAVDSTFAPPPLQNPFHQGVDMVMHSGTKYFGGHSDLLMGILAVKDAIEANQLWHDRTYIGSAPGNMESWLLLRSLRTLEVRVTRQSETATKLAQWLWSLCINNKSAGGNASSASLSPEDAAILSSGIIGWVSHSSLQPRAFTEQDPDTGKEAEGVSFDPRTQMPGGHTPTFCIRVAGGLNKGGNRAHWLGHCTSLWIPATSLGGVESLIEHRIFAEAAEDPGTVRVSVGLEKFEDLRDDLRRAFKRVVELEVEDGGKGEKMVWFGAESWKKRMEKERRGE